MSTVGPARVIVAVGDGGSAVDAVEWASAEAAARGCPLSIVHAFPPPVPADPYGATLPFDDLLSSRVAADAVLREAVARARAVASDVEVSALVLPETPVRALLDAAAGAEMLVLGHRGGSGLRGLPAGSVSVRAAAHAACPVVVVRPRGDDRDPGRGPARVVVGVDGTSSAQAVHFAFRAARQRGIPLEAVHAWTPEPSADLEARRGAPVPAELLARRTLQRSLGRWRCAFADVPVVTSLVRGDPAQALVTASRGAALAVVGSRGRGNVSGAVFGSVSRSVLHHGHSPLAIIRHGNGRAAPPEPDASGGRRSSRRRRFPGGRRWTA